MSTWPALPILTEVYLVAVHTLLPSASCRNLFQKSFFALRMALLSSRRALLIRAQFRVRLALPSVALRSRSSSFHHLFEREHYRLCLACSLRVVVIAVLSFSATPAAPPVTAYIHIGRTENSHRRVFLSV